VLAPEARSGAAGSRRAAQAGTPGVYRSGRTPGGN
jgi:hypothetical protein